MSQAQLILYSSFTFVFMLVLKNLIIFLYYIFEGRIKRNVSNYHGELLFQKFINKNYLNLISYNLSNIQNEILVQSKKISALVFVITGFIKDMTLALIFLTSLFLLNYKATIFLIILGSSFSYLFYNRYRLAL